MSRLTQRQLERLAESDPDLEPALAAEPQLRRRLDRVLDASEALGDHLAASPGAWRCLRPEASDDLESVRAAADSRGLRTGYRLRLLQICADDLTGVADLTATSHHLSDLADATLQSALRLAAAQVEVPESTRLAVVAMGKCGARELNYLSDVDVLFVAEGDLTAASRLAARASEICGRVAWQVDAGLRPEGRSGALVRTVDSYLAYYRRWARTWEFQALLKARPAAGDLELGRQWESAVMPLIWQTADSSEVVDDIRAMRRRVLSKLAESGSDREIKLGAGGLRDIEFAVQLMQLVHGRADLALRVGSTLDALAALRGGGYLGRVDGDDLDAAYRFLRTVEHRLQLQKLRRTHRVPDEPQALSWLARVMGCRDVDDFQSRWRRHAATIRRLHEKLFYRPLLEAVAEVPTAGLRLTPDAARARLEALGFDHPASALRHISAMTAGVSRTAAIQRTLLPVMLGVFAAAPEPDHGLLAYRQVSEKLGATPWYLRLLRDGGPAAQRLARLLATSRYFATLLLREPAALRLLAADADLRPRERQTLLSGMAAATARHRSPEAAVAAVRAIRRAELLRIACADLLGMCDVREVGKALSDLTDAVLHATLAVAQSTMEEPPALAIIGMGRLGGRETSYASDADVLFVYADGATAARDAATVVERMRRLLEAPAAEPPVRLDAGLRPEGKQGPVARSLEAYRRYYARWSQPWEVQALLRARHCAGDEEVADRFLELADTLRYPEGGLSAAQLVELRRVKARVDSERLPRRSDPATHVKLGPGGLADVEWSAQLLQLCHAHAIPQLRTTSTLDALAASARAGLISHSDADILTRSWLSASRVRDALTLARGKPSDQLPRHGTELASVLAALGEDDLDDPGEFVDSHLRTARRAHAVAERIFYGE